MGTRSTVMADEEAKQKEALNATLKEYISEWRKTREKEEEELKKLKEKQAKRKEKFLSKPDVFPMYKACKDSEDQGGFHDFVEILKLYDKNADDTILEFELFKLLVNLGEKLTKEEAKNLMKEL